jgi:hypothetical protein
MLSMHNEECRRNADDHTKTKGPSSRRYQLVAFCIKVKASPSNHSLQEPERALLLSIPATRSLETAAYNRRQRKQ